MATVLQSSMKEYDKLVKELDAILDEKRVSYAQFALQMGIQTVSFYNKYKLYGFSLDELISFVSYAKDMQPNMIECIKCGFKFIPKAKSVKRAMCDSCREELHKKDDACDSLKFRYPQWVKSISNPEIKKLVEQEFHIDEDIALEMSKALNIAEAKAIRADYWQASTSNHENLLSLMNIR